MLDEIALRKPESFVEGHRVPLEDGKRWSIRRPRIRLRPVWGKPETVNVNGKDMTFDVSIKHEVSYGPDFKEFTDLLFSDETNEYALLRAQFGLLVGLLRENYELTDDDIATLVAVTPGDPDSDARWSEIRRAIAGLPPVPEPEPATTN